VRAAHPDDVLRRLCAAVGHDQQRGVKTRVLGPHDGPVEQPGDRLASPTRPEPQPGPGWDHGFTDDGAQGGQGVAFCDACLWLIDVQLGAERRAHAVAIAVMPSAGRPT
jgi:hypothetical protein